jgi:hypothetical protein
MERLVKVGGDMRIQYAAALCLMHFCVSAAAVSPADGTDAVLALHPRSAGELQLQYARDVAGQESQTVSVGLSKDYHYLTDQRGLRLYDCPLHRIYSVAPGNHFNNNSLYADVWFRVTELENRVRLRKGMQAAGIPMDKAPTSQDPLWMETDLGVVSANLPRPSVQRSELNGRISWNVGGAEIVAVRYDAEPVPEVLRPGLRRFWATFVQIHPSIADELAANGRLPQELWVVTQRIGKDPAVTHWKLTARQWRPQAPWPLPPHLSAEPARSTGVFPEIFTLLSREVANHTLPPAQDVYIARAQAALDRGAGLEALISMVEMNLAVGHPASACTPGDPRVFCTLAARAGPLVRNDPRYAIAFAQQSPDLSDRSQFDSLPNAYLLRLLWATKRPGKGVVREDTERELLAALTSSPVADFTKDTGDFYAAGWDPFAAWQVWDLGRLMAGHVSDDLLHAIDSLEDQLYIGVPSLF